MATPHVPIGIGPPNNLTGIETAGSSTLDMTTVSAVSLYVVQPNGVTATWSASIVSATSPSTPGGSTLTWSHAFSPSSGEGTATGDVPIKGTYQIVALLTVPGGVVPCDPRPLIGTSY